MSTQLSAIAQVEGIVGELTEIIEKNSFAFQACGVQFSTSRTPDVVGVKKTDGATGKGFEIVKKTPELYAYGSSEPFTEEMIEDVFNIYGKQGIELLKGVAANDIADSIDSEILSYMKGAANLNSNSDDLVLDFGTTTDHRILIHNLMLHINKIRVQMADNLGRGLPKILTVSSNVAALLITNKMISGNDSDFVAGGRENINFIGKIGDMQVYVDFAEAVEEYVMISHKTYLPGDASIIIVPIGSPMSEIRNSADTGQPTIHFRQRFAYAINPVDDNFTEAGANNADFIRKFSLTLTSF